MSTIGQWTDKKLARRWGDAASTDELPDEDSGTVTGLDTIAERAETRLGLLVNKNDWDTSDDAYLAVQEAATLLTAADILRTLYSDDKHLDKMREMKREANEIIQGIKSSGGLAGDSNAVFVVASDYQTRGLARQVNPNSETPHYLSDY